ncbi:hypothetical protein M8J76_009794 [Diaphorina citri]|nr:hypothetical protein M8J76_009794 [Diaphorina citri]
MKSIILVSLLSLIAGATCEENTTTLSEPVIRFGATRIIEVLTVIDTDQLQEAYEKLPRSKNPDLPTHIGREYAFMITTKSNVNSGQATADLNIKAIVGDTIKWSGTSESNNIDHSIIIYDVKHSSPLVGQIARDLYTSSIVYPKESDIKITATSEYKAPHHKLIVIPCYKNLTLSHPLFTFKSVFAPVISPTTSAKPITSTKPNTSAMKSIILVSLLSLIAGATCEENTTTLSEPVIRFGATRIIEVLTVIDTDQLQEAYEKLPRSKNPDLPTHIGREYAFMITTKSNVNSGQATADLNIKAIIGDTIKWSGNIRAKGTVSYLVRFAMYEYSRASGKYELFGYFTWDPTITVV